LGGLDTPIEQVGDLIDKVGTNADKLTESGEERQKELTERLKIDMASDNKLSKSIRPISLIWLLTLYTLLALLICTLLYMDITVEPLLWFSGEVTVLLGTVLGFYFNSKKAERVQAKRAAAAIEIEQQKQKAEVSAERERSKFNKRVLRQIRKGKLTPEQGESLLNADI